MSSLLSAVVFDVALLAVAGAAAPPPVITNEARILPFLPGCLHPNEAPPYLLQVDDKVRIYNTAGSSYAAYLRPGQSPIADPTAINASTYAWTSQYDIYQACGFVPPSQLASATYWRRNYYGIFSAHLLHHPTTRERCIVAFLHGENKNEFLNGTHYDNTVKASQTYKPTEYSRCDADGRYGYRDSWDNYFGFVGMAYSPLTESDGNNLMAHDMGPVLWPSNGYVDSRNARLSCGLRHPFGIVCNGFIYVFYQDGSIGTDDGRRGGIKVARAPVSSMGLPGSLMNYYNGSFSEPSLPRGFDKSSRSYFSVPGGRSTTLFDADKNAACFRVAKVKDSPYFLGLEEVLDWDGSNLVLQMRCSIDLVQWSQPIDVPGTRTNDPSTMKLNYGTCVNIGCSSSNEIDLHGFFIFGSDVKARAHYRYTTVRIGDR